MSRKSVVVTTGIPDGGAMNGDNDVVAPSAGGADAAVPAVERGRGSLRESSARFAGKYAVILVLFLITVTFSAIKPSTFLLSATLRRFSPIKPRWSSCHSDSPSHWLPANSISP